MASTVVLSVKLRTNKVVVQVMPFLGLCAAWMLTKYLPFRIRVVGRRQMMSVQEVDRGVNDIAEWWYTYVTCTTSRWHYTTWHCSQHAQCHLDITRLDTVCSMHNVSYAYVLHCSVYLYLLNKLQVTLAWGAHNEGSKLQHEIRNSARVLWRNRTVYVSLGLWTLALERRSYGILKNWACLIGLFVICWSLCFECKCHRMLCMIFIARFHLCWCVAIEVLVWKPVSHWFLFCSTQETFVAILLHNGKM